MRSDAPDMPTPLTISAANSVSMTGLSWAHNLRFARAHGVPIWRVASRKRVIPAAPLMAAMATVAATEPASRELTDDERLAALRAELGFELCS